MSLAPVSISEGVVLVTAKVCISVLAPERHVDRLHEPGPSGPVFVCDGEEKQFVGSLSS